MKTIFSTVFFTCFLSFFASAQHSVGLNNYYNMASTFKGLENQIALGVTASKQISSYFQTQFKVLSVFSQESNLLLI